MTNNETDPDIEGFLSAKPFSPVYKANVRSTLQAAKEVAGGKRLRDWGNDDGLRFKADLEARLRNRGPVVKWQQLASFYRWAVATGRAKANDKGVALAVAGIEMTHAEDPQKPTLSLEDFVRLVDHLEATAKAAVKTPLRLMLKPTPTASRIIRRATAIPMASKCRTITPTITNETKQMTRRKMLTGWVSWEGLKFDRCWKTLVTFETVIIHGSQPVRPFPTRGLRCQSAHPV
jgi:hypothetical protein